MSARPFLAAAAGAGGHSSGSDSDSDSDSESDSSSPAAAAAAAAPFPSVGWTLYAHDPESKDWSEASYQLVGTLHDFGDLWATMRLIGRDRLLGNMWFFMRDTMPPRWENTLNIRGGAYLIKTPASEDATLEMLEVYFAAAVLGLVAAEPGNEVVGITISPKRVHHIVKVWNRNATEHHAPTGVRMLLEGMRAELVQYRRHVESRM
jgi:hypothetical protein